MRRRLYWIEILTPRGLLCLWADKAPTHEFKIAKQLGYLVAYGKEAKPASKEWPKGWLTDYSNFMRGEQR